MNIAANTELGITLFPFFENATIKTSDLASFAHLQTQRSPAMEKTALSLATMILLWFPANVMAADFVTVLHKTFREFTSPYEEKIVGMEVVTKYEHQEGGRKDAERDMAGKKHDLLVHELGRCGWKENSLAIDDITAKKMEMIIGYRTKIFVYQCEFPGTEYPYRGEDMRVFFATPIEKMEYCLTYENNLKN